MNPEIQKTPQKRLELVPGRLISLWDMIQWMMNGFAEHFLWIERMKELAANQTKEHGRDFQVSGIEDGHVTETRKRMYDTFTSFLCECQKPDLTRTVNLVVALQFKLDDPKLDFFWCDLESALKDIQLAIRADLRFRLFVSIDPDRAYLFENDDDEALFGKDVYNTFEDARADIKYARTCMSLDLNTAAVFHFVRAAEVALVRLAKVKFHIKKIGKNPVEEEVWQAIIKALEAKITEAENLQRGSKKRAALSYITTLLMIARQSRISIAIRFVMARKHAQKARRKMLTTALKGLWLALLPF